MCDCAPRVEAESDEGAPLASLRVAGLVTASNDEWVHFSVSSELRNHLAVTELPLAVETLAEERRQARESARHGSLLVDHVRAREVSTKQHRDGSHDVLQVVGRHAREQLLEGRFVPRINSFGVCHSILRGGQVEHWRSRRSSVC